MTQRTQTAMQALLDLGQSVWLDYLRRGMLRSGELQGLIDDGLRGMTSNPTIFEHAIGGSSDYDDELLALAASPASDREAFERIAVEDVRQAADLFRPVYEASAGADGFVSLEVSASLARDTDGTIAEARRLWAAVGRPNLMIKVPGTKEGRRSSGCSPRASTSTSRCCSRWSTTVGSRRRISTRSRRGCVRASRSTGWRRWPRSS
jgi:transaldolase